MLTTKRAKRVAGEIKVPGDKSISHRAVMFSSMAKGTARIYGFLPGADCLSTISCFQKMGVSIEQNGDQVIVESAGLDGLNEPHEILDVGNSGTTIRLMSGILAGRSFHSTLIGDESIARRPMKRVVEPLKKMGARIDGRADGNFTPLAIRGGQLSGMEYHSPVASAQVKSAIILAGLQAEGLTTVYEPHLSRDHTERMLSSFGVELNSFDGGVSIQGGQVMRQQEEIHVPGDISSAAFVLAAAAIVPGSQLTVRGVGVNPTRTGIIDVLLEMGADLKVENERIQNGEPVADLTISYAHLKGMEIGGAIIPRLIDEIPIIAVMASQARGTTIIRDAEELKVKETNRIDVMVQELRKMGAQVEPTEDGMIIQGGANLTGARCHSHGDHRIGMSMAIAGLVAEGETFIEEAEAINVSFPGFEQILKEIVVDS
ncbi:3-phosphoshikimate 1-carboxyvinyltransferase [Ammoniphilus sp. CFH 90114]|uniref:3-phosphoshikimate 1-carboxyvinyltransferase n=1 Tax=Ammoniphilus sp. CFH 90114 TaxID=2493665 RepID=UPI00100F64BA|nr:3-phosphoshikimate 1-carboxyvinyltransferase [Ammoniphilus sp. CFH 90114]RXT13920.1 3-phosphoshikimate 1-carboxyvinyltransferase [Ammoniphilus sp. CFH 90114]